MSGEKLKGGIDMNENVKKVLLSILFILLVLFSVPWLTMLAFILGFWDGVEKSDIWLSPLYSGYMITLISLSIAVLLSLGKSKKVKYRIWGVILMIPISLPLAYSMGLTYAILEENPWATMILLFIFPVIFIIGLVLLLVGIFKKSEVSSF